jgi:hypothetical protein
MVRSVRAGRRSERAHRRRLRALWRTARRASRRDRTRRRPRADPPGELVSWGRAPSLATTPYEKAVGIEGKDATRRSWVTRYLRVVGDDTVWIGGPMMTHLPEAARAALDRGALACEDRGSGALVVTVGGRDRRTGVEAVLEALLPSAADFKAFRTAISGR